MSQPLSDALVAAQSRAVAALGKQYRAGLVEQDAAVAWLESFGLDDRVDMGRWFSCLDALRQFGGEAPGDAPAANGAPKKATPNQRSYIVDLLRKGDYPPFAEQDLANLTHDAASEIITALRNGTYDPTKYDVPF